MPCRPCGEVRHGLSSVRKSSTDRSLFRKRQNTKAKFNNLRDRFQWFKDQVTENQTHLTREEVQELIERYLHRFQDELDQIEIKNQIGHRQKTPQHASRKALIETTINTERGEYETHGIGTFRRCPLSFFIVLDF